LTTTADHQKVEITPNGGDVTSVNVEMERA
jgi:hypothetical protein